MFRSDRLVCKPLRLPSPLRLVCDLGDHATVRVSYDHGLPFSEAVQRLEEPYRGHAPLLCLDPERRVLETWLGESDRELGLRIRGRGFGRTRKGRPLTKHASASLVDDLRWAIDHGFALDTEAWVALAEGGGCPPEERRLGWDAEWAACAEVWSWDAMDSRNLDLREQLREAVRMAADAVVHVAPRSDGTLALWCEGESGSAREGFGALVLRREGDALSVHLVTDDLLSHVLLRTLLDAVAAEAYGSEAEYEWEYAGEKEPEAETRRRIRFRRRVR